MSIVTSKSFNEFVQNKYALAHGDIIRDDEIITDMAKYKNDKTA